MSLVVDHTQRPFKLVPYDPDRLLSSRAACDRNCTFALAAWCMVMHSWLKVFLIIHASWMNIYINHLNQMRSDISLWSVRKVAIKLSLENLESGTFYLLPTDIYEIFTYLSPLKSSQLSLELYSWWYQLLIITAKFPAWNGLNNSSKRTYYLVKHQWT